MTYANATVHAPEGLHGLHADVRFDVVGHEAPVENGSRPLGDPRVAERLEGQHHLLVVGLAVVVQVVLENTVCEENRIISVIFGFR